MATPPVQGIHSKPTGLFTDNDFLKAAKQVQNPDLEGWEFFVESMGVKLYRKFSEVGQLHTHTHIFLTRRFILLCTWPEPPNVCFQLLSAKPVFSM